MRIQIYSILEFTLFLQFISPCPNMTQFALNEGLESDVVWVIFSKVLAARSRYVLVVIIKKIRMDFSKYEFRKHTT